MLLLLSCVLRLQSPLCKRGGTILPLSHSCACSELPGVRVDNCVTVLWLKPWQPSGGQGHQALLKHEMITGTAGLQTVRQYNLWLGSATKFISFTTACGKAIWGKFVDSWFKFVQGVGYNCIVSGVWDLMWETGDCEKKNSSSLLFLTATTRAAWLVLAENALCPK